MGVMHHGACECAAQALAGETRQVLNTVKPKIRKFCMLSERNTGSNWVAALLQACHICLLACNLICCKHCILFCCETLPLGSIQQLAAVQQLLCTGIHVRNLAFPLSADVAAFSLQKHSDMPCSLCPVWVCMISSQLDACSLEERAAVQVNFNLEYTTSSCPHKHDLGLSIPNEFMVLPPDTMVVAVFR